MNRSIEGVVTFLRDNDNLIKQLMETAESATNEIEQLADRVGNAREEAQVLVDQLGAVEFSVGGQDDTKVRQAALLEAVAALRKKFETYKNDPLRRGIYAAEISNLYLQLANTFNNETVAQIVPFGADEISGYKELMKKAVLDAASRKKRAAVIKAGAQISRLALGVAGKLALVKSMGTRPVMWTSAALMLLLLATGCSLDAASRGPFGPEDPETVNAEEAAPRTAP
jgi:hypothetical protein